tara:strand:- start:224 stop:442 length:219 start_codon:yes stop_codon:yes gene_type:complete
VCVRGQPVRDELALWVVDGVAGEITVALEQFHVELAVGGYSPAVRDDSTRPRFTPESLAAGRSPTLDEAGFL